MFKVNNKETRLTSVILFWCLYCYLWKYFTPFSCISIVDSEQVNLCWVWSLFGEIRPYLADYQIEKALN